MSAEVDTIREAVELLTDTEIRDAKAKIIGNPKNAGYRARRLSIGESLALAALMAEEQRRAEGVDCA
jgi:hypothetical protein